MKRPEQNLANVLKKRMLTISFAESITCGLLSHKLGNISGTSDILAGSIICYQENVKTSILKIQKKVIRKYTAESQQVTDKLAWNLSKIIKADIHAAITGLAAEGGSETKKKPVGTVFFSFVYKGKLYKMKKHFKGSPLKIKKKACEAYFRFITKNVERN